MQMLRRGFELGSPILFPTLITNENIKYYNLLSNSLICWIVAGNSDAEMGI